MKEPKSDTKKAKKSNGKHPGGRPIVFDLDPIEVEKLASLLCTMNEMAAHFDCSVDTLENRYSDAIKKGRERGKASLRRLQWKSAVNGNVAMQIFLGKVYLKQKEVQEGIENEDELNDLLDKTRNPLNNGA